MVLDIERRQSVIQVVPILIKTDKRLVQVPDRHERVACDMHSWINEQSTEIGKHCHALGVLTYVVRQVCCSRVISIVSLNKRTLVVFQVGSFNIIARMFTNQQ